MFERCFSLISEFTGRRKRLFLALALFLTAASAAGLLLNRFDGNIELMLPEDKAVLRSMSFLRESNLSGKIIVSLGLSSPEAAEKTLFEAADILGTSLKPPLFGKVTTGIDEDEFAGGLLRTDFIPRISDEKTLSRIDGLISPEAVSGRLRRIYAELMRPEAVFTASMSRTDPLGLRLILIERLRSVAKSTGYEVDVKDGRFISKDGRHAMAIIETPVRITDGPGSKELLTALKETIERLPQHVSADIIGGHVHTLENETVLRRDILKVSVIASASFLIVFLFIFRDPRAIFVFLIPLAAVIVSINISSLIMGRLSYWVVGLGTVIAGISIDYGIHVFIAAQKGAPAESVKKIAGPVVIGAVTTIGIFLAFFFSDIRGYRQLAVFTIASITVSLIYALFLLPHFLGGKKPPTGPEFAKNPDGPASTGPLYVVLWAALTVSAIFALPGLRFEKNISSLDGSGPEVERAEEEFRRVWGGSERQAVFVVEGSTLKEALETNDAVYAEAKEALGQDNFSSLSSLWPSEKTGAENSAGWNGFWRAGKETELKRLLKEEGRRYGFSEDAFLPFFEGLYAREGNGGGELFPSLKERFIQKKPEGFQILSFFPDEQPFMEKMNELTERHPGAFVVSRRAVSDSLSEAVSSEVKLITWTASLFIVVLILLLLGNLKDALIALVPVITAVSWLLGAMSAFGLPLNIANLISGVILIGLCIDYGVFMVHKHRHGLGTGTVRAVTLSALTTLIGAGVLLTARHPALFSIGLTMTVGIASGYLSSVFVIPPLYGMLSGKRRAA